MTIQSGHDNTADSSPPHSAKGVPFGSSERAITIGLCVFYGFETVFITALLLILGAGVELTALIIGAKIGITLVSLWLVVRLAWLPTARRFPAQPIGEGAVTRSMQSIAFGTLARWNNCVTITVDEDHLHVQPLPLFRWFGAARISIPLDAIEIVKSGTWTNVLHARVGQQRLIGPAWCLELAHDDSNRYHRSTPEAI